MPGFDWEKAKRRDQLRLGVRARRTSHNGQRLMAIEKFAAKHELRCFVCDRKDGPWAKTGVSKRGPWGICQPCAARSRE